MNIAFRVDASSQIGTGHFMRCLTLADELKKRRAYIRFISRALPEYLQDMLAAKGHEVMLLQSRTGETSNDGLLHSHWLGTSQHADAQATIRALAGQFWDWLVVDHYALDVRWEAKLRQTAKNILIIDDLADRDHDCDMLLDQNYYRDMNSRYSGKVPQHCKLLLGPGYALLRDEFRRLHEQVTPRTGPIKRILIFFGGMDVDNFTSRAIEALAITGNPDLHVDVVIGLQHPCGAQIESACTQHAFTCHVQTSRMAELMAGADLAIGAGGSASWERCCLGLPALLVSLADNQIAIAKALDSSGACIYLGTPEVASVAIIRKGVIDLLHNQKQFASLSKKSYSLVDGHGADNVYQAMWC